MPRQPNRASKNFLQKTWQGLGQISSGRVCENPRTGCGNQAESLKQARLQDSRRLRGLWTHFISIPHEVSIDAPSRLHAATTHSRRLFCGHDTVTTRLRRGHDRATTRSRRGHGHNEVTMRTSHDAFCGHDRVTTGVTTRSRRGQVKPRARKASREQPARKIMLTSKPQS